eukprot:gene4432-7807_t
MKKELKKIWNLKSQDTGKNVCALYNQVPYTDQLEVKLKLMNEKKLREDTKFCEELLFKIETQLETFRKDKGNDYDEISKEINGNLNKVGNVVQNLKNLMIEIPLSQRTVWKRQVEQLSDEKIEMKKNFDKIFKKKKDERDQYELFGNTSKNNLENYNERKHLEMQNESMNNSRSLIEQISQIGINALSMLGQQRDTLKGTQSTMLDIGLKLGLSHTTMKMAQKRDFWDRIIFYVGVFFILLLLFFVWYYKFYK